MKRETGRRRRKGLAICSFLGFATLGPKRLDDSAINRDHREALGARSSRLKQSKRT
jgi:hypothetical protein